jgi:hypothetical protein
MKAFKYALESLQLALELLILPLLIIIESEKAVTE